MKESILAKQEEVKLVSEKMKNSAAFVVFKYQGLTVKAFQTLRRAMRGWCRSFCNQEQHHY